MEQKFYICEHCGKIVAVVRDSGAPLICCGQKMKEIVPGTSDGAAEKHVPVYSVENGIVTVTVGEVKHPMTNEHYIEWVSLQTKQGNQRKLLKPGDAPKVCFAVCDGDEVEAVYAYCNLHKLWKAEAKSAGVESTCAVGSPESASTENYTVCKCNKVTYFDILDEIHRHSDINNLLDMFEDVKDATRCSTGCGGCYNKVIDIISEEIMGK